MVAGPVSLTWLENPPPPQQASLDLGDADGRVPRVPVTASPEPDAALREVFGFEGFRRGQREAVVAARDGRDVLAHAFVPAGGPRHPRLDHPGRTGSSWKDT